MDSGRKTVSSENNSQTYSLNAGAIEYRVIRSRRRTISMEIDSGGQLTVRAPSRVNKSQIEDFIKRKTEWIKEKQLEALSRREKHAEVELKEGRKLLYLGKEYVISLWEKDELVFSDLNVFVPRTFTLKDVENTMRRVAGDIVAERVTHFATLMGLCHTGVKITGARTRWGSCSARNSLNFSWRLVMCSAEEIDYVVVHELCHITHKNHSKVFWQSVKAVLPCYKQQKNSLRENGGIMDII